MAALIGEPKSTITLTTVCTTTLLGAIETILSGAAFEDQKTVPGWKDRIAARRTRKGRQ